MILVEMAILTKRECRRNIRTSTHSPNNFLNRFSACLPSIKGGEDLLDLGLWGVYPYAQEN